MCVCVFVRMLVYAPVCVCHERHRSIFEQSIASYMTGHFSVHRSLLFQGVLNAAPLAYIFPALCVMKLQNDRLLCWKNVPLILTASFGILVSVIGLIMAIIEMVNGVECSHGKDMPYCYSEDFGMNYTNELKPLFSTTTPVA